MDRAAVQPTPRHAELGSASISQNKPKGREAKWTLKQVQGDGNFGDVALQLSAQTALLLGWRPDEFWNATPAELAAILMARTPQGDAIADAHLLADLMAQFPDAPTGGE